MKLGLRLISVPRLIGPWGAAEQKNQELITQLIAEERA